MKRLKQLRNLILACALTSFAGPAFAVLLDSGLLEEGETTGPANGTIFTESLEAGEVDLTKTFTNTTNPFSPIVINGSFDSTGNFVFMESIVNNTGTAWADFRIGLEYVDPCLEDDRCDPDDVHSATIIGGTIDATFNGGFVDVGQAFAIGQSRDFSFTIDVTADFLPIPITLTQTPIRPTTSDVPEPTTLALFGFALTGLGFRRKKTRLR